MEGNDSIMELEVPKEEAETSKLRRKKKRLIKQLGCLRSYLVF